MNDHQLDTVENALFDALTYLQEHPPTPAGFLGTQPALTAERNAAEQQRIIDRLRSAHTLLRVWRAMVRASAHQDGIPVLPGQLSMPGIPPEKK